MGGVNYCDWNTEFCSCYYKMKFFWRAGGGGFTSSFLLWGHRKPILNTEGATQNPYPHEVQEKDSSALHHVGASRLSRCTATHWSLHTQRSTDSSCSSTVQNAVWGGPTLQRGGEIFCLLFWGKSHLFQKSVNRAYFFLKAQAAFLF